MSDTQVELGYVVGGGLKEGLRVRLTVPADSVQEGSFVVCETSRFRYYGLVTDLRLGATDPRFADEAGDRLQQAIHRELLGQTVFTTLDMYTTLLLDKGPELTDSARAEWEEKVARGLEQRGPKPVKTVPAHHAPVRAANEGDVKEIFGDGFEVGQTIEQGYPVRLDLERFVQRSSGIFGATGTGKSFLTRIILAGLICEDQAGVLVFDMHNEYGFSALDSDQNESVRGLRNLFGERVQVAALGAGSQAGSNQPDFHLQLSLADFEVNDITFLASTLGLTDTAPSTLNALVRSYQEKWFSAFMALEPGKQDFDPESGKSVPASDSVEFWARANNVHEGAALALHRRLRVIYNPKRKYIVDGPPSTAVKQIVDKLENGRHVVLSFGKYETELDYLLVSNILTRKIREAWVEKTNAYKGSQGAARPRPLVIAIEEAHKLLSPQVAGQTTFGTIAREMRKYFVTLLVIDQRPSAIDDEIMSQLGTRVTGWLGDDDDIRAVLTGLAGRDQLRGMLARLQEKQEVLLLGWGVKMPIPVRSRRYDQAFYKAMKACEPSGTRELPDGYSGDDLFPD